MTTETTTISTQQQQAIIELAQMRNAMIHLSSEVLIKGQDYGVIPGVSKPSLLKPGAEKLLVFFQLSVEVECTDKVLDLNTKFISYTYKASIKNNLGRLITQCEGSVNSFETKYRYTWMNADKPVDKTIEDKMVVDKTGKWGKTTKGWQWMERIENPDVIGLQNTIQKMAQKRAIVGAVLLATGASEFFTQDVEDMSFIDVEATVVEDKANTDKSAPKQIEEPTTSEKVASLQKDKKPVKANEETVNTGDVPQDTLDAIGSATDLAVLTKIYNECSDLHSNKIFMDALSNRKTQLKPITA